MSQAQPERSDSDVFKLESHKVTRLHVCLTAPKEPDVELTLEDQEGMTIQGLSIKQATQLGGWLKKAVADATR